MMEKFKSGFVALVGRTNVGKSSILNEVVGKKIAAVVNKPQTTRNAIKAIVNRKNSQIVFIDTPGIHKPKSKLGDAMNETAWTSIPDADVVLFVVEATSNEIGKGDQMILEKIKQAKVPTILVINKIDLVTKEQIFKLIETFKDEYHFKAIIPISVLKKQDVDIVLEEIEKCLKEGPAYYDIEEYTDQTLREIAAETIREKAMKLLQQEIPHGILVEIEKMKKAKTREEKPIFNIEATIYCLKNSHKGIIIGKEGQMLKRIGSYARQDLEKELEEQVNLKLWVKVKEDWINNEQFVKKFKNID
ncbi:MAG: GTPase Era [Clostridia bacterium]|nr:GTPase Era [Clostridia bacterium]